MTLARDPNIAIQESRLQASRGSLEVFAGAFDPVINSTLTQNDLRTPLSTSSSDESRPIPFHDPPWRPPKQRRCPGAETGLWC